jgi:phosphate transport system substrate-binding protein
MRISSVLSAMTVVAAGWATVSPALGADQIITIDGSSTVYPVTEAVAEEFQTANKGIKVTVGISGTGGGFKKFCRGEIDISSASRPILASEMKLASENKVEYIELPVCFDALTVVVNKANTWATTMTVEDLKKMWEPGAQGKITKWNQIRSEWPDQKIALYGAGSDSGTFDYFTEAVNGKSKASRGDYTASEDDNTLVRGVEGDKNAIGYFGYAYYAAHKNKLTAVKIAWDAKKVPATEPSPENVINGKYTPLSRPLFIYVNKKSLETKPEVRKFVDFYLDNAPALTQEVKYVPLPAAAYEAAKSRLAKMQTGTVFGGVPEVGVTVEEILRRETSTTAKEEHKKDEGKK